VDALAAYEQPKHLLALGGQNQWGRWASVKLHCRSAGHVDNDALSPVVWPTDERTKARQRRFAACAKTKLLDYRRPAEEE